jgi:hypothetical protein
VCEGRFGQSVFGKDQGSLGDGANASVLAGLVLDLAQGEADLRIVIIDAVGRSVLSLGPFPEEDVIAIWRSMAAASGLTPMMRAWNGKTEPLACQLGRLRLGRVADRRRLGVLNRRRPRFLARRKSARLPVRPLVYREREIAGGVGT